MAVFMLRQTSVNSNTYILYPSVPQRSFDVIRIHEVYGSVPHLTGCGRETGKYKV